MNPSDIEALQSAARRREPAVMTALGLRLLSGDPSCFDPEHGADLLRRAAALDHAQACHASAILAGAGVCQPQDWTLALDYLLRSATLGWSPAQAQSRLLLAESPNGDATGNTTVDTPWSELRKRIDLSVWLQPPAKRVLSDAPKVRAIDHFLSAPVCEWIMRLAQPRLSRARVYDSASQTGRLDAGRNNTETDFNIVETDLILLLVRARIAAATGLPTTVMELTKVLHYAPGQTFAPHYDFIDAGDAGFAEELRLRGQRLATFLVYLNQGYTAGETDFPLLPLRYKGGVGDALYFANVDSGGTPDRQTLHAGLPTHEGEKWLLSQWIRDRAPLRE